MDNLSLKTKLFGIILIEMIISTIILTTQAVNTIKSMSNENLLQYERQVINAKKEALKNYVDMAKGNLQIYRDKVTKETTSQELEKIKKDAIKAMDSMTYGDDSGYVFIWSYDGIPLAFNPRPDLIGKKLLHLKGGGGKMVIQDHIKNAKKGGGHFYEYKWKTTKESAYQTKISYSFGVQEWGWFVGTGEYLEKEEKEIAYKKEQLLLNTNKLIQTIMIVATLLILITSTILVFLIGKVIIKPLNNLKYGLSDFFLFLQTKKDKISPIRITSNDEIGAMSNEVNRNIEVSIQLHNDIKNSEKQTQILNESLSIRVEEKTKELKKQKDQLEQLTKTLELRVKEEVKHSRTKDQQLLHQSRLAQMGEMISMIAHQWRQPLNAISLTSSNLKFKCMMDDINNKEFEKELDLIEDYSEHLSETIDDFRGFFKDEKDEEITTLEKIINSTLDIVKISVENKNIKIITHFNCEVEFKTYPNKIKQVILNLIKNAEDILLENNIKNPTIIIETLYDLSDNAKILIVKDNAGGVPFSIIDKIFDPYFSTKIEKDGTGLGLYMSKTIIKEHCQGSLKVSNDSKGAIFEIKLY